MKKDLKLEQLTDDQLDAFKTFEKWYNEKSKKPFIFLGYSGVGKSFTTAKFVDLLNNNNENVIACGFTAKSVDVLRTSMKLDCQTSTIHSLIFRKKNKNDMTKDGWVFTDQNVPKDSYILVDECSMLGSFLVDNLMRLQEKGARLIFSGDPKQLPPVGEKDLDMFKKYDYFLKNIVRQSAGNPIIECSMKIRNGKIPHRPFKMNVEGIGSVTAIDGKSKLIENNITKFEKVIVGTNKAKVKYDKMIRQALGKNPNYPEENEDLVCLKNNSSTGVYNGCDVTVEKISKSEYIMDGQRVVDMHLKGIGIVPVSVEIFYNPLFNISKRVQGDNLKDRECAKEFKEIHFLNFNHAISAWKSQGSTYSGAILVDMKSMYWTTKLEKDTFSRCLYTSLTRAQKHCVLAL